MASHDVESSSTASEVRDQDLSSIGTVSSFPWSTLTRNAIPCHPETDAILRQVEFYFGDENLPQDAHLLARAGGDGNGPVSINEVLGFKKMRRFRPPAQVKEALKLSKVLQVVNGKQIQRRYPLTVPLRVKPKLLPSRETEKITAEKPWLTKNMLKPTGFETYATEGPIRPEEYEADRKAYDPEENFVHRIEIAVNRYTAKRKMHSHTRNVFVKFLAFGGFETGQRQFGGGFQDDELGEYEKDQRAQITCGFQVADNVVDGIDEDDGKGSTIWSVDFVTTAKAFLSSPLLAIVELYDDNAVTSSVNVLRNFYNYLLLHNVCPEYTDQLLEARSYCDIADEELPRIARLDRLLPGDFNKACSTLYNGHSLALDVGLSSDWAMPGDIPGWTREEAWLIFSTGLSAYKFKSELDALETHEELKTVPQLLRDETVGLEITGVEYTKDSVKEFFRTAATKNAIVRPMGKLICKRWKIPHEPPMDLPKYVMMEREARMSETFEFLVSEETLDLCATGIKMEAIVKTLDAGTSWIDAVIAVYPTFFVWLDNEHLRDGKGSGWSRYRMRHEGDEVPEQVYIVEDQDNEQARVQHHNRGMPLLVVSGC